MKILALVFIFVFNSCNKKNELATDNSENKDVVWSSELKITDIPDTPIKGFINGKEVKLDYINFEQWRGSGDHVLNFGDVKPKNNCGYVESDNSFHLINKAGEIKQGELLKATFAQNLDGYVSYYDTMIVHNSEKKSSVPWNCALVVTSVEDKVVKGKILICFKDEKKSWIGGTFEAIRCFN